MRGMVAAEHAVTLIIIGWFLEVISIFWLVADLGSFNHFSQTPLVGSVLLPQPLRDQKTSAMSVTLTSTSTHVYPPKYTQPRIPNHLHRHTYTLITTRTYLHTYTHTHNDYNWPVVAAGRGLALPYVPCCPQIGTTGGTSWSRRNLLADASASFAAALWGLPRHGRKPPSWCSGSTECYVGGRVTKVDRHEDNSDSVIIILLL